MSISKKRNFLFQQSRKLSDRDNYTSVELKESFCHRTISRKWECRHQKKQDDLKKSHEHPLGLNYNKKLVDSSKVVHHIFQKHIKMKIHSLFITKKAKQDKEKNTVAIEEAKLTEEYFTRKSNQTFLKCDLMPGTKNEYLKKEKFFVSAKPKTIRQG